MIKLSKIGRKLAMVLAVFLMLALFSACRLLPRQQETTSTIPVTEFSYDEMEILNYKRNRILDLLNKYRMNDYRVSNFLRDYNYTAEDYKKIIELDETYLYGFYTIAAFEDVEEMCRALGYADLEDFLVKNNHLNNEGKPDIKVWYKRDRAKMIELMQEENYIPPKY